MIPTGGSHRIKYAVTGDEKTDGRKLSPELDVTTTNPSRVLQNPVEIFFIYRVMRGTREETLRSHIENKGISVNAIGVTSHDDANFVFQGYHTRLPF